VSVNPDAVMGVYTKAAGTTCTGREAMPSEDRELAVRCQRGDADAFRELVLRHRAMVFRVARGIVLSRDDAEDVAQEAFVKAYRGIRRYDSSRDFGTWLKGITVKCAITAYRKRARVRALDLAAVAADRTVAPPPDALSARELEAALLGAIEELPLRQRAAITLFALDEMDLAGIADALGCSVGSVKTHLHRAREKLGDALAEYVRE